MSNVLHLSSLHTPAHHHSPGELSRSTQGLQGPPPASQSEVTLPGEDHIPCLLPFKPLSSSDSILFTYLFTCLLPEHYHHLFPFSPRECELHRWKDLVSLTRHLCSPGRGQCPGATGLVNKWMKEEVLGVGDAWCPLCLSMKLFNIMYKHRY